ncbi:hypothetical protein HanPSC8_Chr17g0786361 [Helianthus annuus]|nr:hypothetical protein HanPSC8_Chr17g0786361 [Helianthus annuus]
MVILHYVRYIVSRTRVLIEFGLRRLNQTINLTIRGQIRLFIHSARSSLH